MSSLAGTNHAACLNAVLGHNQATRPNGRTHVAAFTPNSELDFASRHQSSTAALPRRCCEASRGSPRSLQDSKNALPTTVHRQAKQCNSRRSRSPELRSDHSFAFQPATQASRPPNFEMTRIQSAQRGRRAEYNLPHLFFLHQDSGLQPLAPLSARLDIEASKSQLVAENWLFKRLSRRHSNRVKLVWIYGFVLTVFVLAAGLYPIGRRLALGGGTSYPAVAAASTSLDALLRCNVGMGGESDEHANSGANALSGAVDLQGSTGASLSSDIWGWKRHKGIVYANSHNDELHGDRAFVSLTTSQSVLRTYRINPLDRHMHSPWDSPLSKQTYGMSRLRRSLDCRAIAIQCCLSVTTIRICKNPELSRKSTWILYGKFSRGRMKGMTDRRAGKVFSQIRAYRTRHCYS